MLYLFLSSFLLLAAFVFLSKRFIDKEIAAFFYAKVERKVPLSRQQYWEIDAFLENKIVYYKHLNDEGKARFIYRLLKFNASKRYEGREGLTISEEIKLMVGAAAVQLTFGFKHYKIDQLNTIWIYPSTFYSKLYNKSFKGATAPTGRMFLSAKHIEEGFIFPFDGVNLGIHEMSHALMLSIEYAAKVDHRFAVYYEEWHNISNHAYTALKNKQDSILRKYGGVNEDEFFAVSVEHFFESPEEFQKALPNVYNHLCLLLNQDPQNINNNYILEKGFELRHNTVRKKLIPLPLILLGLSNKASGISYQFLVVASIISFLTIILFSDIYNIDFSDFSLVLLPLGIGTYYGLKKHIVEGKLLAPIQFGAIAATVIAPILISMSFTINYFLPIQKNEGVDKCYTITKIKNSKIAEIENVDESEFQLRLEGHKNPNYILEIFEISITPFKETVGLFGMSYRKFDTPEVMLVKNL